MILTQVSIPDRRFSIGSLMGNIIFVRGIVVVVSMASITQLVKSSALTRVPSICVDSWQVSIISRYEMVAIFVRRFRLLVDD